MIKRAKPFIRKIAASIPFMEWFRDTSFGLLFGKILGVRAAQEFDKSLSNFQRLCSPGTIRYVFDIGANIGNMSSIYLAAGCKVLAVEPDPNNLRRLYSRFCFTSSVTIKSCGVRATIGSMLLNRYSTLGAHDTFSEKRSKQLADISVSPFGTAITPADQLLVKMTTLDLLIQEYGVPDYVKVDVEGYELEVLRGLTHPVRMISFECNLPEFCQESTECLNILDSLSKEYRYNFWTADHDFRLQLPDWRPKEVLVELLQCGKFSFMEIIARF